MTPALFCTLKLKPQTNTTANLAYTTAYSNKIVIYSHSILWQFARKVPFLPAKYLFWSDSILPRVTWRDLSMEITYNSGTFFYNLNLPSAIVHKRNYMKKYRIYLQNRHGTLYKIHELSSGNGEIRCIVGIPTVLYLGLIFLKTQRIRSGVLITRENLKLWR